MKNTLIVIAEAAAKNYRMCMMEHFYYIDMNYTDPVEFAIDLKEFGRELWELCGNPDKALPAFREHFSKGSTMMLLDDEQFVQLEAWDKNNEDFQIAIFKEDGVPVGIVYKKDITW